MSWDSIKLGQRFLRMANGIQPDPSDDQYISNLALQEVLDQCYVTSFSQNSLRQFFEAAANNTFEVPEEIEDVETFRAMFRKHATKVKGDLEKEGLL